MADSLHGVMVGIAHCQMICITGGISGLALFSSRKDW